MKLTSLFCAVAFAFFGYGQIQKTVSHTIEGTVLSAQTGKGLSGVHVFVVDGEEEALTNSKGEFKVQSWQKLPFQLTVEHRDHETTKLTITDPAKKQIIKLRPARSLP